MYERSARTKILCSYSCNWKGVDYNLLQVIELLGSQKLLLIVRYYFGFPSGCILAHKNFLREARDVFSQVINNGKRTEWSPIRPVVLRMINKIVRGRLIAIAERIGWHKILLLINHSYNKICDILSFLKNTGYSESFFAGCENKTPFNCARLMARTVQLLRHDTYCTVSVEIRTGDSQSELTILL